MKPLLFQIVLILLLIKAVLLPFRDSCERNKELYKQLSDVYFSNVKLLEKYMLNPPKKFEIKGLYRSDKDPVEIQLVIFEALKDLIEKKGLILSSFELPEPVKGKTLTEIPIIIKFKGGVKSLVEFFEDLQRGDKRFTIRNFQISGTGKEMNFSVTIIFFRGNI